jgi:hypothetical protein
VSNHPRPRRHRLIDDATAERVALASCEIRGCTCTPELTRRHDGGVTRVEIAHDEGCPALAGNGG